jgi:hypothetical protein
MLAEKLGGEGSFPLMLRKSDSDAFVCVGFWAPKPQERRAVALFWRNDE